ncbi:MAG: MFS transporter [Hyphomicrobiales bacterium]
MATASHSRKQFTLILLANIALGMPMPMLILLGSLAGAALAPNPTFNTAPASVQILFGMLLATPLSLFMGRRGRKQGFLLGAGLAILGGGLGALAMVQESFWALCFAHGLLGTAAISFGFFRFAAAEVVEQSFQPTAISWVLGSGLVAAILGPELFIWTKDMLAPVSFAGAYVAIAVVCLLGAVPVMLLPALKIGAEDDPPSLPLKQVITRKPVIASILCAAVSFGMMMFLMVPTPLAMTENGFTEVHAGDVVRWHVVAMFAPSFFTGWFITRFGVTNVILAGLTLLALSAVVALAGLSLVHFYGFMILLGLGWNFGFIGATHILSTSLAPEEKPLAQGVNETIVALVSVFATFGSGALMASHGWVALAWISFPFLALAAVALVTLGGETKTAPHNH